MKLFKKFLFFIFTIQAAIAPAQATKIDATTKAVNKLFRSKYRPTPVDILEVFGGGLPDKNPFMKENEEYVVCRTFDYDNCDENLDQVRTFIAEELPAIAKSIAILEKVYPNAIYFPMGRDAAFYADILEIFDLIMGRDKRVYRLRASGDTVRALDQDSGPKFLRSNHFGKEPRRPHILIDNTSFSESSQSKRLFRFGRTILNEAGIPDDEHYKYIGVAAAEGWDAESSVRDNENEKKERFGVSTLNLSIDNIFYNGGFWTPGSYPELEKMPSGELAGRFDKPYPEVAKRIVLSHMYELMKAMNTREFIKLVKSEMVALKTKGRQSCTEVLKAI